MEEFGRLVGIMRRLRAEGGCEWDRAQTHETLRQYLIEETHEVLDAIAENEPRLLCEELGDLLLQILFHAQIAWEQGDFDIAAVIASISEKMIRRHPHVFGDTRADSPDAVSVQWEHIKRHVENRRHDSLIGGVPESFPSLLRAVKLTRKASRVGFDWENTDQVLDKVEEEFRELKEAIAKGNSTEKEHELGDLLFSLVNLSRFLKLNPEIALREANRRFEKRFRVMEKLAEESGSSVEDSDLAALDVFWERAKGLTR